MFRPFLIASLFVALGNAEKMQASDMDVHCTEVFRADHGGEGISICNSETMNCDGLYWDGKDVSKTFLIAENRIPLKCDQATVRIVKRLMKNTQLLLKIIQCGALATHCVYNWSLHSATVNFLSMALVYYPLGKAVGTSLFRKELSFDKLYALPEFKILWRVVCMNGILFTPISGINLLRGTAWVSFWFEFMIIWIGKAFTGMDNMMAEGVFDETTMPDMRD